MTRDIDWEQAMARKRKTSGFEDVADVVAMLPWWAGVALAVLSYIVLHAMAVPARVIPGQPVDTANLMIGSLRGAFARVGQYVVPMICLAGAALSAFRRRHREQLVNNVSQSKSADALNGMSWREFELLVGEAFRLQGYRVSEQGPTAESIWCWAKALGSSWCSANSGKLSRSAFRSCANSTA